MIACFQFCRNKEGIEDFFHELREETFDRHQCMTVAEAVDVPYDQLETFIGKTGCFSMMFDFMYSNLDITKNEEWSQIRTGLSKHIKMHYLLLKLKSISLDGLVHSMKIMICLDH